MFNRIPPKPRLTSARLTSREYCIAFDMAYEFALNRLGMSDHGAYRWAKTTTA